MHEESPLAPAEQHDAARALPCPGRAMGCLMTPPPRSASTTPCSARRTASHRAASSIPSRRTKRPKGRVLNTRIQPPPSPACTTVLHHIALSHRVQSGLPRRRPSLRVSWPQGYPHVYGGIPRCFSNVLHFCQAIPTCTGESRPRTLVRH